MEDKLFDKFNLTSDQIDVVINDFINNNSNEEGIDASKIYLANLTYCPTPTGIVDYQQYFGINCPINMTNDYNKMAVVFILKSQSKKDHIFIDMFNKTILQSTYVNIPGLFTLMPEIRKGVTVSKYISLRDILEIDRLSYQNLESIFNEVSKYDQEDIVKLSKEEVAKLLLFAIVKKKKK